MLRPFQWQLTYEAQPRHTDAQRRDGVGLQRVVRHKPYPFNIFQSERPFLY